MITLTTEQAQQIEEALDKLNSVYGLHETPCVAKALATIRAARAQEQAEQEPVALDEVRRIAAEYAEADSQVDSGNLYWALCGALQYIDVELEFNEPTHHVQQEPVAWLGLTLTEREDIREKHDGYTSSIVCATENILRKKNAAPQPVKQEPLMDYERINALREGEQNGAEDAYFFVRPENDTPSLRKMFCQGFERGFHKGLKYASHVRTKDLTDEEIVAVHDKFRCQPRDFARAVIAADREKNRV